MKEKDKHYTPDISELYVGYECELKIKNYTRFIDNFIPYKYGYDMVKDSIIQSDGFFNNHTWEIKTKYLDQQDIESLGWKLFDKEENQYSTWCKFKNKDWELYIQLNDKYFPRLLNLKAQGHCSWKGNIKLECKSINELRTIMRFLNIK